MRILICMTHYCPWSNPTAATLQSFGHEVHIFDFADDIGGFLDLKNSEIASDLEIYRKRITGVHLAPPHGSGKSRYIFGVPGFRRLAKEIDADIVLTLYGGGFGLMAYLSGIRPFAVYVVGTDILKANKITKKINRIVLSSASQVFANGEYLATKALEQSPKAKILPLLIGVDLNNLNMSSFGGQTVQLLCTRFFFSKVYNNDAIIRAISLLPDNMPDFRMVFVSGGPDLKSSIALADRILSAKHRKRVVFWGGVSYDKVLTALQNSHVFLSMSQTDGTSTSILEAMGSGLFPILSDIPQNRTLIGPNDPNGILVPLGDEGALSAAIYKTICNVDVCKNFAEQNRRIIEEKANALKNRKILAEYLQEIVRQKRKGLSFGT